MCNPERNTSQLSIAKRWGSAAFTTLVNDRSPRRFTSKAPFVFHDLLENGKITIARNAFLEPTDSSIGYSFRAGLGEPFNLYINL